MNDDDNTLLIQYLTDQGLESAEIEQVLAKLAELDQRAIRESVFDSIADGTFDFKAFIAETTREQ
jgi:hypothetical protein